MSSQDRITEIQSAHYQLTKRLKGVERTLLDQAGTYRKLTLGLAARKATLGSALEYAEHTIKTALKSRKVDAELKALYIDIEAQMQALSDEADALAEVRS